MNFEFETDIVPIDVPDCIDINKCLPDTVRAYEDYLKLIKSANSNGKFILSVAYANGYYYEITPLERSKRVNCKITHTCSQVYASLSDSLPKIKKYETYLKEDFDVILCAKSLLGLSDIELLELVPEYCFNRAPIPQTFQKEMNDIYDVFKKIDDVDVKLWLKDNNKNLQLCAQVLRLSCSLAAHYWYLGQFRIIRKKGWVYWLREKIDAYSAPLKSA